MVSVADSQVASSKEERAKLDRTLPDGTVVIIEVVGPSAEATALRALNAAGGDVVERKPSPRAPAKVAPVGSFGGIVGNAPPMKDLFHLLERIRSSSASVLITGENGTGKELVAKAIHQQSRRGAKAFVATNCSAFNDNLLESELFGHKRGSFTGAVVDKPGLFEVADGGTFFLDEVGDMSPALQVKLLRVLQEGVFLPVGATEQRKVDVRVIAATNRNLEEMVAKGTFREDLYYRLHVVALRVPALRDRREDIPLLVGHFMRRLADRGELQKTLAGETTERLIRHEWPGNVRELENEIERLWVLSGDETVIGVEHLTPAVARGNSPRSDRPSSVHPPSMPPAGQTLPAAVEALEKAMIINALRAARGNKTRAADELGVSRRNLIRKVQAYGLENPATWSGGRTSG